MKLGVFGGSFDPVHYGHLLLAENCREACGLDEVWFVPAAVPPHKQDRDRASDDHRWTMLELAIAEIPEFRACDLELRRGGVSYTVDTLEYLQAARPDAELHLLLGGDSMGDFPTWKATARIVELATLAVVRRGGRPADDVRRWREELAKRTGVDVRCQAVEMPAWEVSSSELRRRAAEGRSLRFLTPPAVASYIQRERLYRKVDEV